jgi:hypothetical protein
MAIAPDEILEMAEREGVAVGVRHGRLSYRGGSATLTALLKAHEADVVEALGHAFRSPIADDLQERSYRWA